MDEALLAEKFSRELDKVLAGKPAGKDMPAELSKELDMAKRIASSDLSDESGVRESLKAKLAGRGAKGKGGAFIPPFYQWSAAAVVAVAAFVVLAPRTVDYVSSMKDRQSGLVQGFSTPDGLFPDGNAQYEAGTGGFSPGGLHGQGTQVVTPLNASDPSAMVMGAGRAAGGPAGSLAVPKLLGLQQASRRRAPGYQGRANKRALLTAAGNRQADIYHRGVPGDVMWSAASVSDDLKALTWDREANEEVHPKHDTEAYDHIPENPFRRVADHPLSTFSIDVDAASYANVRRFLNMSRMPPRDAVRIEELINYFNYDYPEPSGKHPFSITTELAACPWRPEHKLVHVGLKGKSVSKENLPPSNLVFLIDSSGSMSSPNKLELLKKAFRLLTEQLRDEDRIAIVAYAGSAGLVLPSTRGSEKAVILEALERLSAGGSTAGGAGIQLAYNVAAANFLKGGNNRIILATDGDFNVGVSSDGDLVRIIEEKRKQGVFLTILGFGTGNYKDAKMEKLADKGNGNYAYIDSISEAQKVLVHEMGGTLLTIAKDVKIQIEFNPARAQAYRLIGYENRMLRAEDFNNDKKDAGELGAGHTVTALYEVVPVGVKMAVPEVDKLKYQKPRNAASSSDSKELLTVKFRYKKPDGDKSTKIVQSLDDGDHKWSEAPQNLRFSAAVAGFGMLMRGSKYSGNLTYTKVRDMARESRGEDPHGYRSELIGLVEKAKLLDDRQR